MMIVREFQPTDSAQWNDFVRSQPTAVVPQLYEWTLAIGRVYNLETLHLAAFVDNHIVAILPLALIRAPLRDPFAVSLPYSGYAGMLVDPKIDSNQVFAAFLDSSAEHGILSLEVRQLGDSQTVQSSSVTLKLHMPDSSEVLWNQLDAKVRNLVRKAERSGLQARWGPDQMEDFYRVHARNMAHLGTPMHSKRLFIEISKELPDVIDVLTVRKDAEVIAAMLVTKLGNKLAGPWASSLSQYTSLSPNMLLYWEVLKYGCQNGFSEFDFGRSQVNSGTYNFKKQWGATPVPIENLRVRVDRSRQPSSVDFYQSKSARALSRLWRLLPFPISLWAGPRLRKYMP
jgi:FemAB-related protein (PEP-CTERM system-associated)